jgi:NADH-quinone oxidoreductase subunit L
MTGPLMALAVGAVVAGLVGVPAALGGNNAIEHFLEPSFVVHEAVVGSVEVTAIAQTAVPHMSPAGELGLMVLSIAVALIGIGLAYRFYVVSPDTSEELATRFAGAHRVLTNKYYVDELYGATVVRGTLASGRGLWTFDSAVVDGGVNGTAWLTMFFSWVSHMLDKYVVDGTVNLVGWTAQESSYLFRRLQTGLIQNYALLMLTGVFALVSLFLFAR